ncbi:MAG: GNAT family N-acetyltransferase [Promethearchaeota archaeon]
MSYEENELKWKKRFENLNNKSIIYVAETENQKIVGFALAHLEKINPIPDLLQIKKLVGELGAIYVLKEFQGKKIRTKLV